MVEPELPVLLVDQLVRDRHVLVDEADIELERLHDRRDVVALDPHEPTRAGRVDRTRPHPQIDGDVVHLVEPAGLEHDLWEQTAVHEHAEEHVLMRDRDEL